ncbi:ubiquitin fusion degradation protein ufd1ap [Cyclospora cayetanensis]|uniref:Ubiquitin fusion degradation protein ufd1ap n=1 Tax=Cyclospora cayetanensis TaxID=88456 RepID=A0A1D3D285_9EIME|nr:ubiquitin fusion degradation protein ufd1ap [Cyclospora cayetanensis]
MPADMLRCSRLPTPSGNPCYPRATASSLPMAAATQSLPRAPLRQARRVFRTARAAGNLQRKPILQPTPLDSPNCTRRWRLHNSRYSRFCATRAAVASVAAAVAAAESLLASSALATPPHGPAAAAAAVHASSWGAKFASSNVLLPFLLPLAETGTTEAAPTAVAAQREVEEQFNDLQLHQQWQLLAAAPLCGVLLPQALLQRQLLSLEQQMQQRSLEPEELSSCLRSAALALALGTTSSAATAAGAETAKIFHGILREADLPGVGAAAASFFRCVVLQPHVALPLPPQHSHESVLPLYAGDGVLERNLKKAKHPKTRRSENFEGFSEELAFCPRVPLELPVGSSPSAAAMAGARKTAVTTLEGAELPTPRGQPERCLQNLRLSDTLLACSIGVRVFPSGRLPQSSRLLPSSPPPDGSKALLCESSRSDARSSRCCCWLLKKLKSAAKAAQASAAPGRGLPRCRCSFVAEFLRVKRTIKRGVVVRHFSYGRLHYGDAASIPSSFLEELLAKRADPPWHFVLEPVRLEKPPSRESRDNSPQGVHAETAFDAPAADDDGAKKPSSVSVGTLDFASPEGFIFLPPWVMEALGIQSNAAVFCRHVPLPVGATVQLRPADPNFLTAAAEGAGGIQGALERELRHFSSLTAGTRIPMKIAGTLFLFKVEKILDEDGKEVPKACIQDTDVALQLLPPERPSEGKDGAGDSHAS